jgi:rhamnulose-1-phosphate aldolase/alcohol dehydrogenase
MAVIDQARQFVEERLAGRAAFGGLLVPPLPEERRQEILVEILPVLRGAVSAGGHKILCPDDSAAVLEFVGGRESSALSQIGAACPDHLVHTKMRPLWIDFDPSTDDMTSLSQRIVDGVEGYREEYQRYLTRNQADTSYRHDPNPRVVLVPGVGLVGIGQTVKAARLARDLYHRAIAVMRGAASLDRFVSLDEAESYAIEYWPLELYKLTLASPSGELTGRVALVTGGAGGIGRAVSRRLAEAGALVVVADLDAAGAEEAASELGDSGLPVAMDVTKEAEVAAAYRAATLAFGGVDIVVSNAGLASSAPVEETTLDLWKRNHEVLSQGYFLVAREAFRVLKRQRTGGSIVFVVSKNSLVAGRNASAYSSAKAAELHLARCLAEEGGEAGIRVNVVNPDAVLQGSRIWDSAWRAERARTYGIEPEELEAFYRERTTLKVDILPDDIADAVLFFANDSRSGKSTGNILNVDGGVPAAYPR